MAFLRFTRICDFVLVGVLAVVVLSALIAISPAIWTAMKLATTHTDYDPRACLAIKDETERLHCLEARVGRDMPPAHGAYAPRQLFDGSEK